MSAILLPKNLSDVVEMLLKGFQKLSKDSRYEIDPSAYHEPATEGRKCVVGPAGILAATLLDWPIDQRFHPAHNCSKDRNVIRFFRSADFVWTSVLGALSTFYPGESYRTPPRDFYDNPFPILPDEVQGNKYVIIRDLQKIISRLRDHGY